MNAKVTDMKSCAQQRVRSVRTHLAPTPASAQLALWRTALAPVCLYQVLVRLHKGCTHVFVNLLLVKLYIGHVHVNSCTYLLAGLYRGCVHVCLYILLVRLYTSVVHMFASTHLTWDNCTGWLSVETLVTNKPLPTVGSTLCRGCLDLCLLVKCIEDIQKCLYLLLVRLQQMYRSVPLPTVGKTRGAVHVCMYMLLVGLCLGAIYICASARCW